MFKNSTVRTRLLAGFLIVAILGAIVAAVGVINMSKMNAQAERAYASDLLGLSASKEANINLIYIGRAMRNVLLSTTPAERSKFQGVAESARKTMAQQLDIARPLFYTDTGKRLFAEIDKGLTEYDTSRAELTRLVGDTSPEGHTAAVEYAFGPLAVKANYVDDKLTELGNAKQKTAAAAATEASELYHGSRTLMIVLVLCSLGAGIGLGLWITHSLTSQLGGEPSYAAEMADAIAKGELSTVIQTRSNDKSSLLFAMETMRTSLVKIVGNVRMGTDTIATASNQIAVGNLDLSSRTEEQASSLEETASSMEELTSTVKQNADNARQANGLAKSASEVAIRGGSVVSEVVDTMAAINESSRKIVDIIGVIDGIAFQTNILALNAAVEAARAGEQGRGFAVVASEVRNLAQRSAAAAKEIKTLINDSVEKVDAGGKLVDQAGVTMEEIVQSITRVTDIMTEIAAASAEQTMGIEQINTAITQMDEVTQQNAALVEEAAAAAGSMQEQAATLAEVVSIFKLGNESAIARPAAPLKRPAPRAAARPVPRLAANASSSNVKRTANGADEDWEQF
ncbi:methyl-accepting chemotaxis protein [Massilia sp. CF038]|uniref:methyl-accepting chemotaxis protein n=1 Tax=Massilia sp. CF038 TaxID=1881045 RepID=UPI0009234F64|nr:methyl-accepting chemotaxis protein [Massilia sp. CF038]SHH04363.1 methyl-accepting chemotaxis protein [Massilia sp. CF038]